MVERPNGPLIGGRGPTSGSCQPGHPAGITSFATPGFVGGDGRRAGEGGWESPDGQMGPPGKPSFGRVTVAGGVVRLPQCLRQLADVVPAATIASTIRWLIRSTIAS